MLKKYPEIVAQPKELKIGPSPSLINALINYSKSLEVKNIQKEKVLIHLN